MAAEQLASRSSLSFFYRKMRPGFLYAVSIVYSTHSAVYTLTCHTSDHSKRRLCLRRPAVGCPEPDVQPQRHLPDAGVVPAQRPGGPAGPHLQRALQALRHRGGRRAVPTVRGGPAIPTTARGPGPRHSGHRGLLHSCQLHV